MAAGPEHGLKKIVWQSKFVWLLSVFYGLHNGAEASLLPSSHCVFSQKSLKMLVNIINADVWELSVMEATVLFPVTV